MRKNFTILLLFLIPVFSAQLATAQTTFSNTNAITINDNAAATPYPSGIVVSGMPGTIVSMSVKINGFSHQFPSDVYMLLVGPGGQNLVFWGGAGGAAEVSGLDITINDAAPSALPQNSLTTGTYRPSDYEAQYGLNVSFPSPAPASPYSKAAPTGSGTLASNFAGTSPNGTWNLYVEDVESGFAGSISGGWSITITHTVPSGTTTNLSSSNLSPYTASPNNSVTLTATVTSSSTVNGGTVTFKNGSNDISGCSSQPVSNGTATCSTSFSTAGKDTLSAEYNGTVNFAASSSGNVIETIYQHPTLSIDDVSEYEGNSGTTTFTFTVTSSSPAGPGITFDVATADNTATTADNDYVANSLTNQSIHQDSTTYTFDVTVNGDTKVEPDENFYANLSNVSANASMSDGQGIGTIQNDDCTPQTYYADNDGDTYGDPGNSIQSCTQPDGYVTNNTDCNDNDVAINPATVWYKDADNDGYSDGTTQTQCERPSGYKLATELTATSGDCDDNDAAINPAAVWYKDADDDGYSDGTTQTQCERPSGYKLATELTATSGDCDDNSMAINPATVWYKDADNDGYSDGTTQTQCERPSGYKLATELTATSGDCNDNSMAINPATVWYKDADNDGYSDGTTQTQCERPSGYKLVSELSATSGDCNDDDAAINPATVWYKDADDDGYSDGTTQTQCERPSGYKLVSELSATSGDCNDDDVAINPATVWYKDADDDGYSDGTTQTQCERPSGYKLATELTATSGDCNDNDAAINPATVWYKDADDDGYSDGTTQTQCERPSGYKLVSELSATSGDCNDAVASIHPGAVEICGNGIDDNCNGQIDEGCSTCGITVTVSTGSISCYGGLTTIIVKASGGKKPYQYKLSGGLNFQLYNIFIVGAGTYSATVMDKTGCTKTVSNIVITQPAPLTLTLVQKTDVSCRNGSNGKIVVSAGGGTTPYKYKLNNGAYGNSGTFQNLKAGNYIVTAKDAKGCTKSISVTIKNGRGSCSFALTGKTLERFDASLSPNPAINEFMLQVSGNSSAPVNIRVTDMYGRKVYETKGAVNQSYKFGQHFTAGVYIIEIIQGENWKIIKGVKQ